MGTRNTKSIRPCVLGMPALLGGLALGLVACTPRPEPVILEPTAAPPGFPGALYRTVATRGETVYRIDPKASEVRIQVYRDGSLARFGHNHLISGPVQGYAWIPAAPDPARADLFVRVDDLEVDGAELRRQSGAEFAEAVDAKAIAGTTENMRGPEVLDARRHPFVRVHVAMDDPSGGLWHLRVRITLGGKTHTLTTPGQVTRRRDRMTVNGEFVVRQSDFGITPYSVLGGALRVRDELRISYRLLGLPMGPGHRSAPPAAGRTGVGGSV